MPNAALRHGAVIAAAHVLGEATVWQSVQGFVPKRRAVAPFGTFAKYPGNAYARRAGTSSDTATARASDAPKPMRAYGCEEVVAMIVTRG
jgi:hypothetical protein